MRLIDRQAARLIVTSPRDRLLLLRLEPSFRDGFWVTPGGGLDDGETFEQAAERELYEEVGRADLAVGPCLWIRKVVFTWEDWRVTQVERSYLVHADREFDPVVLDPGDEPITDTRWFGAPELASLDAIVYPVGLSDLFEQLLAEGVPREPISLPDSVED